MNISDIRRIRFSKILQSEYPTAAIVMAGLLALYAAVYAEPIFSGEAIFGGDSYVLWSLNYLIYYSVKTFGSFPWWDPTSVGGHPLYFHFISGWNNIFSPYYLPSLILFKVLTYIFDVSINSYIVFHRTLYVNAVNMIAIYLISRELLASRMARFFPVVVYAFSYIQLMNFHDFYTVEAMAAPLFFLFALLRFNNRRSIGSLMLLFFLLALLIASLHTAILISSLFWTALFTLLLIVFKISILKDAWQLISGLMQSYRGKIIVVLSMLILISGLISIWLPYHYNAGHELRYRGGADGTQAVTYDSAGSLTNEQIPIESSQIISLILHWIPSPELHDYLLQLFHHGHENRYIGLVTLPLLLAACTLCLKNRHVFILFLTYFFCNAFLIYTSQNIAYKILTDNSEIFRNIRNMATMFPRGGPPLFLIFMAGIGLDRLLAPASGTDPSEARNDRFETFFRRALLFLISVSLLLCLAGFLNSTTPAFSAVKPSLLRIGSTLLFFSALCFIIPYSGRFMRTALLFCLFPAIFADLTMAGWTYMKNRNNAPPYEAGQLITMPYAELEALNMTIPENTVFKPAATPAEGMFPVQYIGAYHRGIYSSSKEWLVLVSRKEGRRFLPNWTTDHQGKMTKYPDFRFFSNGYYLPFEKIRELDTDMSIYNAEPLFYLHDRELVASTNADPREPVNGNYRIEEYTPTKVVMRTWTDRDGFLHFLDNLDRFWSASVDEKEVTIHRSNFTFKAIKLPAGEHTVAWTYNPWPIKTAYAFFYLVLSATVLFAIIWRADWLKIASGSAPGNCRDERYK